MEEIQILYEDEYFLVINKPSGVTVNKAETTRNELTVQDWMEQRYADIFQHTHLTSILDSHAESQHEQKVSDVESSDSEAHPQWDPEIEFYKRGGVVHRLDKETSGILLLAKTPAAFAALQKQFKERTVHKTYMALVHGKVLPREGEISVPVGRLPWNRKQFGIVPGGRPSITRYKTLHYVTSTIRNAKEVLSLVELHPETGRTHQIRVHMKYLGYPLFGDFLYTGRKTSRDDRKLLERFFLHAAKIEFLHPVTGVPMEFVAPLPQELQAVLNRMENVSSS